MRFPKHTLLACSLLLAAAIPAAAQHVEVEVDPIAYILDGFSVHVAYPFGQQRLDLGVFGAEQPEFFHGNEAFSAYQRGITVKWDYFFNKQMQGFFTGLQANLSRLTVTYDATGSDVTRGQVGLGARVGYRFNTGLKRLYIVPWLGVTYGLRRDEIVIDGQVFEQRAVGLFPTVHLGWRF